MDGLLKAIHETCPHLIPFLTFSCGAIASMNVKLEAPAAL